MDANYQQGWDSTLTLGTYYYYCVVSAANLSGTASATSSVATVKVTPDNSDIAEAMLTVLGEDYTAAQADVCDITDVRAKVEEIIGALQLGGVSAVVNDGTFVAAEEVGVGMLHGKNGSYTFTVTLSKGAGTPKTTSTLMLAITATPYDATTDIIDVGAAKSAAEGASYTGIQANAGSIALARAKVKGIIDALPEMNGVTATAGSTGNASGTEGSYGFTVTLSKGAATDTTAQARPDDYRCGI